MRFSRSEVRRAGRGWSPKRIAAAKRAIARQPLDLFRPTETLLERQQRFDQADHAYRRQLRSCQALLWRRGRARLYALPLSTRARCLAAWNDSPVPAQAEYFADFMRRWSLAPAP